MNPPEGTAAPPAAPVDGATSTCVHCDEQITWFYDVDSEGTASSDYGWWYAATGEVCFGTDDSWHRPFGATADNGWPE